MKIIKFRAFCIIGLFLVSLNISQFYYFILINKSSDLSNLKGVHLSTEDTYKKQWLKNPNFTSQQYWYSTKQGDKSDVNCVINDGQAKYKVIGDSGLFELIGNPFNSSNWTNFTNPKLPVLPDNFTFDQNGLFVEHKWDGPTEQLENNPSIHYKQNITMPVNMSDYIITSAVIQAVVNATVTVSPVNKGIEALGDNCTQFLRGDYIHFYVLISDVENKYSYYIDEYITTNLGQDGPPAIDALNDTYMIPVPEEILISYLTSILKIDDFNFIITLGIDIFCEDNLVGSDRDYWNEIRIKYINLTFSYQKKINQFTSISLNQDGDRISNLSENKIVVKEANLNFLYKIDTQWPYLSSPNSEIKILINNNLHPETIKLSTCNLTFYQAKISGFNVISLITDDVNFSLQLFLADTFGLARNITISIDDVILEIAYIEILPSPISEKEPWIYSTLLIFVSIGTVTIGGYLFAYQRLLKYPKPVRKVRRYRRTLKKKKDPKMNILLRENAFKANYEKEISPIAGFLKGKSSDHKKIDSMKERTSQELSKIKINKE